MELPCYASVSYMINTVTMHAEGERLEGQRWGVPRLRSSDLHCLVCNDVSPKLLLSSAPRTS